MAIAELEAEVLREIEQVTDDPLMFVERFYPWGEKELAQSTGPRRWQAKILALIRDHLRSPKRFHPCFIAVASGKGIGKSALVSMIIDWAMSTCGDCKIVVTANTGTQL